MDLKDMRPAELLRELVAVPGISGDRSEKAAGDKVYEMLSRIDYFKRNGGLLVRRACPGDGLGREIIYAIIRGSSDKAIVLMGHYDVVGIEDYGKWKDFAFDIDALPDKLRDMPMDESAAKDLESGEWIFGRGAADMKAGLAIDIALLDELSRTPQKGNIIFLAVPDEESFSVGMRAAVPVLRELKDEYGFEYELCADSEPARRADGKHIMSLGTVGKCMPVVLVQGVKAHMSMCFDGLNPLSILEGIFRATELNLDFTDEFDGARTMPPSWNYLKDMKYEYDVSLPIRAGGYFTVLSYFTTPEETMAKLRKISEDSFGAYVSHMKRVFAEFNKGQKFNTAKPIDYETEVMTAAELLDICRKLAGFEEFHQKLYESVKQEVGRNELTLPQATMKMMGALLDFSGITKPLVLLGFAPPFYAPLRSNEVNGKENKVSEYLRHVANEAMNRFGIEVCGEEYTGAMTDLSYCAMDREFDYGRFAADTPLWGDIYSIDFESVKDINIPGILFGPWAKDYHQAMERVNRQDVEVRIPALTKALVEYVLN